MGHRKGEAHAMDRVTGATQQQKAQLREHVDADTYEAICATALRILDNLPTDVGLGTLTAALTLAATAYIESAPHAQVLIRGNS